MLHCLIKLSDKTNSVSSVRQSASKSLQLQSAAVSVAGGPASR